MADVTLESTEEIIQLVSVSGASQGDITTAVTAHNALATAHGLNANIFAALTGAASPSAGNVLATVNSTIPVFNVKMYSAVADGATDCRTAFQAAIDAAAAAGGGEVYIPKGSNYYLFDNATPLSVPSNVTIRSNGAQIYQGGVTDANGVVRHLFVLEVTAENVSFEGLHFIGAHAAGGTATANWSTVIREYIGVQFKHISIRNCTFENLVGYTLSFGDGQDVQVTNCRFLNTGGGVNINAKQTLISGCLFSQSGGCECGGYGLQILDNKFYYCNATSIISAGGYIQAGHYEPDVIISDNIFYSFAGTNCVSVAESAANVKIHDNIFDHLTNASGNGINVTVSNAIYLQKKIDISDNLFDDLARNAIVINDIGGSLTDVSITDNYIGNDASSSVFYGCYILGVSGLNFTGNYIHTSNYTVTLTDCPNSFLDGNDLKSDVGAGLELLTSGTTTLIGVKQYSDLDFSSSTAHGPIIADRSNGHNYRIKSTGGVLGLELSSVVPSIYQYKVRALWPIAYWQLSEAVGATSVLDASGNDRVGTPQGVTFGVTGIGDGNTAASFPTGGVGINVFSASLASAFTQNEFSVVGWFKVTNVGVWSDGSYRQFVYLYTDANNYISVDKSGLVSNTIRIIHAGGGAFKNVNVTVSPLTTFFHFALTVSKSGDYIKMYLNGVDQPTGISAMNTWTGALTSGIIGATNLVGGSEWYGSIAHYAIFGYPLSSAQIATLITP